MKAKEILGYLSYLYNGDWERMYKTITNREKVSKDEIANFNETYKGQFICIMDEEYPESLKRTSRPPFVLFYKGDLSLLNDENYKKTLSVVGSRDCSAYGRRATTKLIEEMPEDTIIVSGLAKGIDSVAHWTALNTNKKTIAVLGCGLNNIYPKENKELFDKIIENGGLIMTEYPDECEPDKENFLIRNRIIACLGKALLVGEANLKSGNSRTVKYALTQGKDVGCIPYHLDESSGCNQLIKDGAYLIETKSDLMNLMGVSNWNE